MSRVSWKDIQSKIVLVQEKLVAQHFKIDLTYKLNKAILDATTRRTDLNTPAISSYWANEIYQHYVLNDYNLTVGNVFFDLEYYAYLDIMEVNQNNASVGENTYIVDYIADTTDLKTGTDIDSWMDYSNFGDLVENEYTNLNHDILVDQGLVETRKNRVVVKEKYWKYSNWLYQLRVMDENFQPIVIFILGAYSDY
ncbi:MAG: hypothetical protein EXR20_09720 [Bacteroidetes bacterium]|nr:hypothetical protein [Bacteroidota bacterium]